MNENTMKNTAPEPEAAIDRRLAALRAPFPDNQISKLPKRTCSKEEWDKIPKGRCAECGGHHQIRSTIHLDYVGHAAITNRLLDVDPHWTWEPVAMGPDGPVLDKHGGLWIRLTVCGITRLGYGSADGKTGGDAIKELIGDAIRNAAMRFGIALPLWHKGGPLLPSHDLLALGWWQEDDHSEKGVAEAPPAARQQGPDGHAAKSDAQQQPDSAPRPDSPVEPDECHTMAALLALWASLNTYEQDLDKKVFSARKAYLKTNTVISALDACATKFDLDLSYGALDESAKKAYARTYAQKVGELAGAKRG